MPACGVGGGEALGCAGQGVETIVEDMLHVDPEWHRLATLPGLQEGWADLKVKVAVAIAECQACAIRSPFRRGSMACVTGAYDAMSGPSPPPSPRCARVTPVGFASRQQDSSKDGYCRCVHEGMDVVLSPSSTPCQGRRHCRVPGAHAPLLPRIEHEHY